ncbi:MAG: DUF3021 domain-containing protein [Ruminococcus sp.]|nr:DUF3021 domain-containing protein [Ruminococcus sp.]
MRKFVADFFKRGALFCWGGPVILAVIYIFLSAYGVVESISVERLVREILTSTLLAFIAAGISAIHTVDKLQPAPAALIHCAVLYADYIMIYLLNGWLRNDPVVILMFTVIFLAGFALMWAIIYFSIKSTLKKMNKSL